MEITHLIRSLDHMLSDHPIIVGFRWSHTQSWGSSWAFLVNSISAYAVGSITLHIIFLIVRGRRPVSLGPIPALHSLSMTLFSAVIFAGTLSAASAEISQTRWLWRRSKTPVQWLLCFPLGTRPSRRVFFWSYAFYLSRFLHVLRTFITILRRRRLSVFKLFNNSLLIVMSFLWLEFSQSFQVVEILFTTLSNVAVYGYRFWTDVGLPPPSFPLVTRCQIMLMSSNVICHFAVMYLHQRRGGRNGMGAWAFNSVINVGSLLMFLKSYMNMRWIHQHAAAAAAPPIKDESKSAAAKE